MILYVIRHGEPDYATDTLTPTGVLQAEALGKWLGRLKFDRLFSSPLGRARQTAEPTARRLNMEVEIEPWASEALAWQDFHREIPDPEAKGCWVFDVPNYKYHTPENRRRDTDWMDCDCLRSGGAGFHPEEGMARIGKESDRFLGDLGYERDGGMYRITRPNDERVALFCHAGFGSCWLAGLSAGPAAAAVLELCHAVAYGRDGNSVPQLSFRKDVSAGALPERSFPLVRGRPENTSRRLNGGGFSPAIADARPGSAFIRHEKTAV